MFNFNSFIISRNTITKIFINKFVFMVYPYNRFFYLYLTKIDKNLLSCLSE